MKRGPSLAAIALHCGHCALVLHCLRYSRPSLNPVAKHCSVGSFRLLAAKMLRLWAHLIAMGASPQQHCHVALLAAVTEVSVSQGAFLPR